MAMGLLGLALLLSGCSTPTGFTKFKIEHTDLLCDEVKAAQEYSALSDFGAVKDCINSCGSRENYSSWDCSGKYFTCYCEKDPAIIAAENASQTAKTQSPYWNAKGDEKCRAINKEDCLKGAGVIIAGGDEKYSGQYECGWDSERGVCGLDVNRQEKLMIELNAIRNCEKMSKETCSGITVIDGLVHECAVINDICTLKEPPTVKT